MYGELKEIRKDMLRSVHKTNSSHIGGALSVVDILYTLYDNKINEDIIIFSKGHCSIALYAVLKHKGLMTKKEFDSVCTDGSKYSEHLDRFSNKNIFASTGSLGHGLPMAVGAAMADRNRRVFVVIGDGETQEGTTWEALRMAVQYGLENLIIIIDYNKLQGLDKTYKMMTESRLFNSLKGMGCRVLNVDGTSNKDLYEALFFKDLRPRIIIAHTIKGHPISYMCDKLEWHYKSPNEEQLEQAFRDLDNKYGWSI